MWLLLVTLLAFLPSQAMGVCPSAISSCFCTATTVICSGGVGISTVKEALISNSLEDTITVLNIAHSTETVLPQYYVRDFPSLTTLDLQYGHLSYIAPGAFANASNLQEIDIRNNRLTWLSGEMLEGVTSNLMRIRLNYNMISQLLSDLAPIFGLLSSHVSSQISLNGNNLNCSCQLQWLNDFISSNQRPSITGATCTDSSGVTNVLGTAGLNFTKCLDLCSLGYYNCPINTTCIPSQLNESYDCITEQQMTPSPSVLPSPSPSFIMSPSPSLLLLSSTDQFSVFSSSYLSTEVTTFLPFSSLLQSSSLPMSTLPLSSTITTSVFPVTPSPSPSPTMPPSPPLCSMELCQMDQDCVHFGCGCSKCQCPYPLVQISNQTCAESAIAPLYCDSNEAFGLQWPRTSYGSTVSLPCCSSNNSQCSIANRTCQFTGQWGSVIGAKCVSPAVHGLSSYLLNNASVDVAAFSEDLLTAVQSGTLLPGDIPYISDIILKAASFAHNITSIETIQAIIESVSQLLSDSYYSTWQQVESPSQSIATLLNAVELFGFNLPLINGSLNVSTDNLVLIVLSPSGNDTGWDFSSRLLRNHTGGESSIFLPASILRSILGDQNLTGCDVRIVVSMWDIDSQLLEVNSSNASSTPPLVHGRCDWGSTGSSVSEVITVNSIVITASVYSSNCSLNNTRFVEPVRITLHHVNTNLDDPTCSFLDPANDRGDGWVSDGCHVDRSQSGSNFTVCNCYHLTTFALLMSPTGAATVNQPLLIATKVGLCLSIIALIITIILLFALKIESELNQVHRQLALALCLSQIVFLVGVDRSSVPSPDILCTFIAALLHYLLLCTFSWQLVEGIHLYLFIVKVFYNKKIVWFYYPLAWGIPLGIVGITMGVNFCDYGSLHYCWITNGNGALWAFHIPVIIVIIVNVIVLFAVSMVVARASKRKDPNRCALCSLLQASIILVPTLGLTWVLGFFVVGTDLYSTIVEWVFFVCTTMQGLTLFVIHCLVSTEVRTAFLRAVGCHQAARKQKSIFELKPSAALSSIANSAEQWRRRVSLGGSRRGSMDPPIATFPSQGTKEVNAYLIANALYKLEEESIEDPYMFDQINKGTPKKNANKQSRVRFEKEEEISSDTESCKDDMLLKGLLHAEDLNKLTSIAILAGFKTDAETSETESVVNATTSAISVEPSSSEATLKTPLLAAYKPASTDAASKNTEKRCKEDLVSIDNEETVEEVETQLYQENTEKHNENEENKVTNLPEEIELIHLPVSNALTPATSVKSHHSNGSNEEPATNDTINETTHSNGSNEEPATNDTINETTHSNGSNEEPATNDTINETTHSNGSNEEPATNDTIDETTHSNGSNEEPATTDTINETTHSNGSNEEPATNDTINETTVTILENQLVEEELNADT